MVTAVVSLVAAMASGLIVFGFTRHYIRADLEEERLRQVEVAAAQIARMHDRLSVIETAIQATGERVNAIEHNQRTLISQLRVQGVQVTDVWHRW